MPYENPMRDDGKKESFDPGELGYDSDLTS